MGDDLNPSQIAAPLDENYRRNRAWAQRGSYQTKLPPRQEQAFQAWVWKNGIPFSLKYPADQRMQDYDMRGFWLAMQSGDPLAVQSAANKHFPDKWKTPYHSTFSAESMYALPNAPRWQGNKLVDEKGNVIFDEEAAKR